MTEARKITRTGRVLVETEIDGDLSLYDESNKQVTVLNATASDVWRLCDGELTIEEIIETLAKAYEVPPAVIAPQVEEVLEKLEKAELLAEVSA